MSTYAQLKRVLSQYDNVVVIKTKFVRNTSTVVVVEVKSDDEESEGRTILNFMDFRPVFHSDKSKVNLKSMLVSHAFVDLWRMIE
ncbi:hypothetical protein GQ600_12204 [Phytophthora cactorum]|nr:hypothetical protein GQ600_12204 [Phytophthora cactorum]